MTKARNKNYFHKVKPYMDSNIDWGNPLTKGLVSCIVLNDRTLGDTKDKVSRARATVSGSPEYVNRYGGVGVRFPSTNDLLTFNIKDQPTNQPFTLFIKAQVEDTIGTNRKRAVRLFGDNGTTAYIEFSEGIGGAIFAGIQTSPGIFQTVYTGFNYNANQDYTLALKWNGSSSPDNTKRLFVNGLYAANGGADTTIVNATSINLGGNTSGGGLHLRGTLYYAFYWNRNISDNEILKMHENPYRFFIQSRSRRFSYGEATPSSISSVQIERRMPRGSSRGIVRGAV